MDFENSGLGKNWARAVKKGNPNDFVICVTASGRSPVSGTGKTTLTTRLAQQTDLSPGGFDAAEKASLDAGELAYQIMPSIPDRSTLVWDEAQGAPGTVGLDSRRAMKTESIDAMSAILANRDKQLTIIITAQLFPMLDPRIYPIIDAWLLIRYEPDHPRGPRGTYHKCHIEDYNFKNPQERTPAIEDFSWDRVPHDDPDYRELERLKQLAKTQDYHQDGNDEPNPKEQRDERIRALYEKGVTQAVLADSFDLAQSRISEIVNRYNDS